MNIAEIAPPWVRVPPERYGGIEWIVALLADGLVERGHDVTLYASGDSETRARLRAPFDRPIAFGDQRWYEAVHSLTIHTMPAFLEADRYDIIHDHSGPVAASLGALSDTPVLHTLHGPFDPGTRRLFHAISDEIYFNSVSDSQRSGCPELNYVGTVYNAVQVGTYPFREQKDDYALFLGRICEDKGVHNAIDIARRAGVPLRMAGKVDPGADSLYFEERIKPRIDGENIVFEGEVDGDRKRELLARARFLLFPIQWEEPFGLVMTEALACGTPVMATAMGAAPEIVEDGEVGVLVGLGDWDEMVAAIRDGKMDEIDPHRCRRHVEERFGVEQMLDSYETAFERILSSEKTWHPSEAGDHGRTLASIEGGEKGTFFE
jgi:glycosyltransferase involved in cell wall biosynthesis